MDTIDVITRIVVETTEIQAIRLFRYESDTRVQNRMPDLASAESAFIEKALAEKSAHGLGFWESLIRIFVQAGDAPDELLRQCLYHNQIEDQIRFDRSRIEQLRGFDEDNHAVNSKIEMGDGTRMHIPMLDFDIASEARNLNIVTKAIRALGLRGYILDSGRSFHFIGRGLLHENQMIDMLASFVLLHPISDKSWAVHQIIERSCSLRVSRRYGHFPSVAGEVT